MRSVLFVAALALMVSASCAGRSPGVSPTKPVLANDPASRVGRIADAVVDDIFTRYPERAAQLRVPGLHYDALPDDSVAGARARETRYETWLNELRTVDPKTLDGTPAALSYGIAYEYLDAQLKARACRFELWPVSQMTNGWQIRFTNLAEAQPVGTDDLREQALRRFGALPAYIDAQVKSLGEGLAQGYSAPKGNVRLVIEQIGKLIAAPPNESPFASPAQRDTTPAFRDRFVALIRDNINPALRRYKEYLETQYLPAAREAIGVSSNPEGAACYRAAVRLATTLDLDPVELQARGNQKLAEIEGEIAVISQKNFGNTGVPQLLHRMREDPAYRYKNKEEVLAQADAAIKRADKLLPNFFHLIPKASVKLEPIPAFQEKTSAAHYLPAALDGSRPATYRVRLYQPEQQSRIMGETTAFHETIPGHHLQIGVATERAELPAIARFAFNSGYSEGWGLYAERLADEMGLFSSDEDRLGMLSAASWRAVRLVVDTGIHALGWDRQRAIDMLLAHTAMSPDQAAAEIDRYIAWPGQATAYMVGFTEIMGLRERAKREIGPSYFLLPDFHDRVLEQGGVTLTMLRRHIDRWIEEERRKHETP